MTSKRHLSHHNTTPAGHLPKRWPMKGIREAPLDLTVDALAALVRSTEHQAMINKRSPRES